MAESIRRFYEERPIAAGRRGALRSRNVTDAIDTAAPDEAIEPTVLYTAYFSSADELLEHVRAADTLGLGVRVESYTVTSADNPNAGHAEFEFTLLSDAPVRIEERD
jgi:hypothetical protein